MAIYLLSFAIVAGATTGVSLNGEAFNLTINRASGDETLLLSNTGLQAVDIGDSIITNPPVLFVPSSLITSTYYPAVNGQCLSFKLDAPTVADIPTGAVLSNAITSLTFPGEVNIVPDPSGAFIAGKTGARAVLLTS